MNAPSSDGHVFAHRLYELGGEWLSAARGWIQSNMPNGERVRWGSGDQLHMTVEQFERAAACIAASAINADRRQRK